MKTRQKKFGWLVGAALALGCGGNAAALDVGVFGDMSLAHSSAPSEPSFRLGSLDLYAAQYIDDNTRALFEVQFQTFSGGDIEVEIQRFWIMREISDALNIGIGRFHTPIGYWNRHYHHGILLQDTVSRPFILSFEGGATAIIPTHLIGVLAEGDLGSAGWHYEAAVSNSNTVDSSLSNPGLAVPNRADLGSGKSLFGRIHYGRFGAPFKPGVFVMKNDVLESSQGAPVSRGDPLVRQMLYGLDFRYERRGFDVMAEYYHIVNDAQPGVGDGRKRGSDAWFAQFGYRITGQLKATYRYEGIDFDHQSDPYYLDVIRFGRPQTGIGVGTERRDIFALRYDFSESNAIMLEVNVRDPQFGDRVTSTFLSWAFVMY